MSSALYFKKFFYDQPPKDPSIMAGGYDPEQYQRDVVRMRIIRSQQLHQIKVGIVTLDLYKM